MGEKDKDSRFSNLFIISLEAMHTTPAIKKPDNRALSIMVPSKKNTVARNNNT